MDLRHSLTLFLAHALIVSHIALAQEKIKGMAFGTGHNLFAIRQPFAEESLRNLQRTGINMVHVSSYAKLPNKDSFSLRNETDEASIRFTLRLHKRHGLKVFFKPVIEIDGEVWRGFIPPRDDFLRNVYTPWILSMAHIAQQENVDLFAVGSEYVALEARTQAWRDIIAAVRRVYTRELTYVANHDSFKKVQYWDAVDVISISAYFILLDAHTGATFGRSPDQAETDRLWAAKAEEVHAWRSAAGMASKKILIAEVGAQSKGNGVVYRKPWLWTSKAPVDQNEQMKMYEGILGAFMPKKWCRGVILWNWELRPDAEKSEPGMSGYTPQGKMALGVMDKFFHQKFEL